MKNRLAGENSPYLIQHAENPVDWYPWGPEALEKARIEDKPIFLSIGYAACHWCHVMAHESFEDPDTAALMNQYFVNIKVDREERPDLDGIYMQAVTALTGSGGWPMSVFLTPDGQPFYGGTYFPPARRYQMPSFPELLEVIARLWREDRQQLLEFSAEDHPAPANQPVWRSAGHTSGREIAGNSCPEPGAGIRLATWRLGKSSQIPAAHEHRVLAAARRPGRPAGLGYGQTCIDCHGSGWHV